MPTVDSLLVVDEENVRKWPTQLFYLQAPDAAIPTEFISATDYMPILPADAIQLGFITTDGVSVDESLSSEDTQMLQSLEPVRSDLTGIARTLTIAFGEDNAYVQALWHGVDFASFPTDPAAPWVFEDGAATQFPYYRAGLIMSDGVGSSARYRHEYGYRVTVNSKDTRTLNRSDPETFGVTFSLLKDPTVGKSYHREQDGPSYTHV
ncbi:hypothetical protein RN607_00705 [Demequina capsici]|uniref:Uncharacterized protein n=1 Tax=Demequina capsici TaxID=3075620 RepID=A0AA96JB13_9MICO|nr:hypothetical protein [Demequina sp. PMTSA13]WNM27553.1 hypothetical protein RN607_00705 [Demequina sp. PMTSA13]